MRKVNTLLAISFLLAGCAGTEEQTTTPIYNRTEVQTPSRNEEQTEDSIGEQTVSANNKMGRQLSILALTQQNDELSTFFELIRSAGLTEMLTESGEYTVFAPTNEAFNSLSPGTLDVLKEPANQAQLTRILTSHILEEKVMASELRSKSEFKTENGEVVKVKFENGNLTVGDARIIQQDINASNGTLHIINKVLVPPSR